MKIKAFGFSRITTEQLEEAVSSKYYGFYCGSTDIQCVNCPFACIEQSGAATDIREQMSKLARAELKRREEEC